MKIILAFCLLLSFSILSACATTSSVDSILVSKQSIIASATVTSTLCTSPEISTISKEDCKTAAEAYILSQTFTDLSLRLLLGTTEDEQTRLKITNELSVGWPVLVFSK